MLTFSQLGWFALAAFVLVITPGPNMIYCVSRTLCQGRAAGMVSLVGVLLGFFAHALAAAFGLTALLLAVPFAFGVIKAAGAAYLLWMAWQAVRPGGAAPFQVRDLPVDAPGKLFRMGFLTNVLNPKVAMFYLSFLPQFLHPEQGSVLLQSLELAGVQILISGTVNSLLILGAASISAFLARSRGWMLAQRYLMGGVLAALAARIALSDK